MKTTTPAPFAGYTLAIFDAFPSFADKEEFVRAMQSEFDGCTIELAYDFAAYPPPGTSDSVTYDIEEFARQWVRDLAADYQKTKGGDTHDQILADFGIS